MEIEEEDEVMNKYREFKSKRFDLVRGTLDHHYIESSKRSSKYMFKSPAAKKITREWTILEKNLPEEGSIFVRGYEDRMDLMRAVIVGSQGTPFANALFFLDILFPNDYPSSPPKLFFHSHALVLSPHLGSLGNICVSLLTKSFGRKEECRIPRESTLLQVLISIQALILNEAPFSSNLNFEPSHSRDVNVFRNNAYVFRSSCLAMVRTLKNPPMHFESFVAGHFRQSAHSILINCLDYKPYFLANGADFEPFLQGLIDAFEANGACCKPNAGSSSTESESGKQLHVVRTKKKSRNKKMLGKL